MSHHKKSDAVAHDRVDPAVKQNLVMPIVRVLADMKKQFGSLIFLLASVFVLAACMASMDPHVVWERWEEPQ